MSANLDDLLDNVRGLMTYALTIPEAQQTVDELEAAIRADQRVKDAQEWPLVVRDGELQGHCPYDCDSCHDDECPCPNCLRAWGDYDETAYLAGIRDAVLEDSP